MTYEETSCCPYSLRNTIKDLENQIYVLECGNDILFTGQNGDLELYKSLCVQKRKLQERLLEIEEC